MDKLIALFLCLLVLGSTQNSCAQSNIAQLQAGQIILNPNDLGTAGATKNYYQSLSSGAFKSGDYLGYAFAIAGFETSCFQGYYSLVVDVVQFQNQNTNMMVTVDFRNPTFSNLTVWTKVKLTYLVVSSTRYESNVPPAYIWATNTQIALTSTLTTQPIFQDDIFRGIDGFLGCGLTFDSVGATKYNFGINCGGLVSGTNDVSVHAYLMGFQFKPNAQATGQLIAASALLPGISATGSEVAYITGDAPRVANGNYGVQIIYDVTNAVSVKNGPKFTISNYAGQLQTIKIAIVLTVINPKYGPNQKTNGFNSIISYSYSGLYSVVNTASYNVEKLIDSNPAANYNNLYEKLPTNKYRIYGLSSFALASGSGCTSFSIDVDLNTASSYTVKLNQASFVSSVVFQADIFTASTRTLCNPGVQFSKLIFDQVSNTASPQLTNARTNTYLNLKYFLTRNLEQYSTIPSNTVNQNVQQIGANPLNLKFTVNAISGDSTNVRLNAQVVMTGITSGKPYGFRVQIKPSSTFLTNSFHTPADASPYLISVGVNGYNLFAGAFTAANLQTIAAATTNADKLQKFYGINLIGTNATVYYNLTIPRNSQSSTAVYTFQVFVDLFEFQKVYDPVTQCCVGSCPAKTGLDVSVTPAVCVVCDQTLGLQYDPSSASCICKSTYYSDPNLQFQCFPCQTSLCASCSSTATTTCLTCVTGAILNALTQTCSCATGFYQINNTCTTCPAKCSSCSVSTVCTLCADKNRDILNNCSCIAGYYDSGIDICQTCNPSCSTCSNLTTCLTCDPRKFRLLIGGVCGCQNGFYEIVYQNGTRQCNPCSSQCGNCTISATTCSSCDPRRNRVSGYDNLGHSTCVCLPGYYAIADGSCVQSDCKADKYCSQCQADLSLCIQCIASVNRVIKLPEHICVCAPGYYQDANGNCTACGAGCAICSSATVCISCVVQATNNGNGTCSCAAGTLFTVSSNGVRFCQQCVAYCSQCSNSLTCASCLSGFVLATDNTCVCPKQNYVNSTGQCTPCLSGCAVCTSSSSCSSCVAPLLVQQNICVVQCSEGYFLAGSVCTTCPTNCLGCTSNSQCFYCKNGYYLFAGSCYQTCPSGTVANNATFQCVACNSPCRTCNGQPSICTSCEPGGGYLQITSGDQQCVTQCALGTYPNGNVCQVCDFTCAQCLGTSTNCIACPAGIYLYNSACWSYCPGVMNGNQCVNTCPAGYFRQSNQTCQICKAGCLTCADQLSCLTCQNNSLSLNGLCVTSCGDGYYTFRGLCVACDKSCKNCANIPTQCTSCAKDYIQSGAYCLASCASGTFLNAATASCQSCPATCLTCQSATNCLSCPNSQIQPVGGQCLTCIYPCSTCSTDLSTCYACLSGFYISSGQCIQTCPSGSRPVNGICSCSSGIFFSGTCVSTCPSGYANINGTCVQCTSPCTSCSNSPSFCTSCLETFVLTVNTGVCQPSSVCNYGQEELNGKCQAICPAGSYYQNGACIFGGCPSGYSNNGFGGCICDCSKTKSCQSPTFKLNNACVTSCGKGYFPNSNTRTCETCEPNCQSCLNNNYCMACATGFTAVDGNCLAQSKCKDSQYCYNQGCVSSCPIGTFTNNGVCVRSCRAETFYYSNLCYTTCPTQSPYFTKDACVAACPTGTTLSNNVCV